jgi:hypothetical protein
MAKAPPAGESKTPIIVALVFFVLLTLGLGVMLYMSYDEKAAAVQAAKDADKKAADAGRLRTEDQDRVLFYREMLGVNSQEETSQLKANAKPDGVVRKEYAKVMGELRDRIAGTPGTPSIVAEAQREIPGTRFDVRQDDVFTWPWPDGQELKNGPQKGLFATVVTAYAKQLLASQKQATAEKTAAAAAASYQKLNAEYTSAVQTLKEVAASFGPEVTKAKQAEQARVNEQIAKFDKVTKDFAAELRQREIDTNALKIESEQRLNKVTSLGMRNQNLEDRLEQRQDPFAFEKAHGRITKRSDRIVYIDLGSAQKVRPGLTFTVQPSDTPERGIDSRKFERDLGNGRKEVAVRTKGTIEVIEVLGPNLSQARVTSEPDPIREGILVGDTLYNAAWRPGTSERVALYGVFDVDADGTDDLKSLVQDLTKMGIIVDAYYDLEQRKWVGTITNLTTYCVEGYLPTSTVADPLSGAKSAIIADLEAARRIAQERGVKVVKAREFFPRIGYEIRLDITPEIVNRSYNRYLQAAPVAGNEAK